MYRAISDRGRGVRSIRYDMARMRKIAGLVEGPVVLDVGYAQVPNPYLTGCHRVGYDLNAPAKGEVQYDEQVQGDVRNIRDSLAGRTFDTIICAEIIEHLHNPYEFLQDIYCLLRDGGLLIVTTPNPIGFPVFLCEIFRIKKFFYTTEHLYYFLPRWVERLIEFSGFEMETIRPVGWWLPFGVLGLCPVPLSYQVIYAARKR